MPVKGSALVPIVGAGGDITWQQWDYGELVRHLQDDLQIDSTNLPLDQIVRGGLVTLTWAGTVLSANAVVSHGLGHTPQSVVATAFTAPATGRIAVPNTFSWTNTTFSINADVDNQVAFTGSAQVSWLAI